VVVVSGGGNLIMKEDKSDVCHIGLVSVIIPNYNGSKTLQDTVESVIKQTYNNWELIIVDDCSVDNSSLIIKELCELDDRISNIKLIKNSGTPAVPRNEGIDKTRGEFIAFLDADDIWHPQKLELQVYFLYKHKTDFCFTQVLPFKNNLEYISKFSEKIDFKNITYKTLNHRVLLYKNFIKSGSSVMVSRNAIGSLRFNEDPKYKAIEDYLFWLNLHQLSIPKSYNLKAYLVAYRLSDTSISRSKLFMLRQNINLYHSYQINGKYLGIIKKIYYLLSYIILSLYLQIKYIIVRLFVKLSIYG